MKISKYIKLFFGFLPALVIAGCADNLEPVTDSELLEVPDALTLTLKVPDATNVTLSTRANNSASISSITLFCFDKDGWGLSTTTFTSGWQGNASDGYTITMPLHKKTHSIRVITNAPQTDLPNSATDPSLLTTTDPDAGCLWGRANLSDLISSNSTLALVRQNALFSVTCSASSFTYEGFSIEGTAKEGTLAPHANNVNISDPANPVILAPSIPRNGVEFTRGSGVSGISKDDKAVFETTATHDNAETGNIPRIIIKGQYKGTSYYYPVALRDCKTSGSGYAEVPGDIEYGDYLPLLRNHHYTVQILDVRGTGWLNYNDACKADPENRVSVLITDTDASISKITSDSDNMLGISGDLTVDYNGNAEFTVLTTYNKSDFEPHLSSPASWIHCSSYNASEPITTTVQTASGEKTGYKYTITIPLETNNVSADERTASVYINVGNLQTNFNITQKGYDFRRADDRKVIMKGFTSSDIEDYFKWLDNECIGVTSEQNRGQIRNEGLHFPALKAYSVSYYIPKLTTDTGASISEGSSYFTFTTTTIGSQEYYKVDMVNNTSNIYLVIGKFKITANSGQTTIEYPLYSTGIFHQLTSATNDYQPEGKEVNGTFYYEVVKVGDSYILDRNLGASSNDPYISTYTGFKNNVGAIGGYFKISDKKSSDYDNPELILGDLNIYSGFDLPTKDEMNAWGVKIINLYGTTGENSKVASVTVTASQVQDNIIYIPHGGYYEGTEAKYETHANLWTKTLLSGAQGFSPTSPEFGFWYLYFNAYSSSTVNFTNIRFCNGSAGQEPNEYSIYKYMPVRLIWRGN